MNRLSAMMLAVLWAVSQGVLAVPAEAAESGKTGQVIVRNGEQASIKGADTIFTGSVRIDPLYAANNDMRSSGGSVPIGMSTLWGRC